MSAQEATPPDAASTDVPADAVDAPAAEVKADDIVAVEPPTKTEDVAPSDEAAPAESTSADAPSEEVEATAPSTDEPASITGEVVAAEPKEEICDDGIDNDGDTVMDCGDSDCAEAEACQPNGAAEISDKSCSDWIDNDGNGYKDCDDHSCDNAKVCQGTWKVAGDGAAPNPGDDDIPELQAGMSVEDLIGKGSDKDGERNDQVCSDGIDNDGDGRVDCADIGCRFDPQVTVCRGTPGIRFSMVANITHSFSNDRDDIGDDYVGDLGKQIDEDGRFETRFSALQLRAFGPLPGIQDSFFLISGRAERSPRMTFVMAQFPIWGGHNININSGGGGLSNALVLSNAKRLMVGAPFYVYNAFEQGNGAAMEFNGPIIPGWLSYRAYVGGGSGLFNGNLGGRYFSFGDDNYNYSVGAQLSFNPIGFISRWDSEYLYTTVPLAFNISLGVRHDARTAELFQATNLSMQLRWGPLLVKNETFAKYEHNFGTFQSATNITVGLLAIPKWLMLGFDAGGFLPGEMGTPPAADYRYTTGLRRQRGELQWRAAAHLYIYRNIGILSAVVTDQYQFATLADMAAASSTGSNVSEIEVRDNNREFKLVAQFRF
ncbi:MAG: hypothetical protein GY822_07575 [Deltaproteobacteria bacterium]|nr:hypothetical protein [Deltaproteobacteria bacterium]